MSHTFDCYTCFAVWWGKAAGPHTCECGAPLVLRPEGAEPFAGTDGAPDDDWYSPLPHPSAGQRTAGQPDAQDAGRRQDA